MSGIVIISDEHGFDERIRSALGPDWTLAIQAWASAGLIDNGDAAIDAVSNGTPDVVAIGPDVPGSHALKLTEQIVSRQPSVQVLILAPPSLELWKDAVRAGARDLVDPAAGDQELREVIGRLVGLASHFRAQPTLPTPPGTPTTRQFTVVSPKGGSGKTTVATNLAASLAKNAPGEVVIVDLDLQFGDVANAFRLSPEHTIFDATRPSAVSENTMLKVFLSSHASGVYVLAAPFALTEADQITPEDVINVLRRFREEFRYVIVDTAAGVDEYSLAAIECSTDLVALSATDVPSVRAIRKQLDALDAIGLTGQKRHFILNRADAKVGLDVADIQTTVGLTVDVRVPSSRSIPVSTNLGEPVAVAEPRSDAALSFSNLVAHLEGEPMAAASTNRSLFRWRQP